MQPDNQPNQNPEPQPNNYQPTETPPIAPETTQQIPNQPQPVYGNTVAAPVSVSNPNSKNPFNKLKNNRKASLLVGVAFVVLLLGGGAAAYFGVLMPNSPEKLWTKALSNTATGYDKLVEAQNKQDVAKGLAVKGNYKFENKDIILDGNIESKYLDKKSSSKIDIGASGARIYAEILSNVPENSKNPDVYAKVSGLKGIDKILGSAEGSSAYGNALAAYDNQWYVIDHTLFDQAEKEATSSSNPVPSLTKEDITAIEKAVGKVNRDYIFTEDPTKAVLTRKENIGKETQDGRSVYHYKVGFDKEHLKSYVTALTDELKQTKLKENYSEESYKQLLEEIQKMDANSTADVWVDTGTKTIRTIRFTDKAKPENHLDIGIHYTGGNEVPFVIEYVAKEKENEGKLNFTLTLNTNSNVIKVAVLADGKQGSDPVKFNLDATMTPSNEAVEFTKPANAKSIMELYNDFLGGSADQLMVDDTSADSLSEIDL